MRRLLDLSANAFDPLDVLFEGRLANAGEGDPDPPFVKHQDPSTPAEQGLRCVVDHLQVDDLLDSQRVPTYDDEGAIHAREVDPVAMEMAVMGERGADPDPPVWTCQTHRVPLLRARDPQFGAELKHELGMGLVRLGLRHLP